MGPIISSSDEVVIKSPNDRRTYRVLHLFNALCAVIVHDPEIFGDLSHNGSDAGEMDCRGDQDDMEDSDDFENDDDDEDFDDEEDDDGDDGEDGEDESEPRRKKSKGAWSSSPTKKAAAAMCVGMGSFSDPLGAQGLAHFLEHMLFMGSSEFPDENEYDRYLSKHGGSSNAFTETEYTCYHFDVNREFLKGALERFSQFFISPLVKAEAMEREVLAVDSEFNQALQSDACRLLQLHCHTASPGHKLNRFFWGNKKSLVEAMGNGINLREEILEMYKENYHGGMMKLVIIGGEPLDTLENWVVELFSKVKPGPLLKMSPQTDLSFWRAGKFYKLEAVKDLHALHLSWTLPCLHEEYLKKPEDYLSHLMGHEGRGSLLYFLKAKGWAISLSAGVADEGMRRSSIAFVFIMSINLTDSGLEKVYDVISAVYQYIKLLRQSKPQEWVFKELQDIGYLDFRFAEEQPQDDYAVDLAENLLFYSEKHIICGDYLFEHWDPELVEYVLSFFSPDRMRVDLLTKSFDKHSEAIQYEPWFGSRYIEEDIPPAFLSMWQDPPEIDSSLHLPQKNEFIPCDFTLRGASLSKSLSIASPKCVVDNPFMKFWYKTDLTFNVPRANTYFLITVKDGYKDVKNCVLTELLVNLLKDELNDVLYQAGVAKLESNLCVIADKLELKLYGYNDKLTILLSKILATARSFTPAEDRFKVIKEGLERGYKNTNMKPLSHSSYLRLQILRECFWDVDDKLSALQKLSLSDLTDFMPNLLSQIYVEGLCHGNLLEKEVISISNIFASTFPVQPLSQECWLQERVICLPQNARLLKSVPVKNDEEVNSVVELYFQIEQDTGMDATRLRAITDLFSNIVEEPLFDQLRTKEQLGYTVLCGPRMTYRVLGFCIQVQSSEYGSHYLQSRIENFIDGLQELLDGLDDESYEYHREGLIADKLEKDPSLTYETGNYWSQIVDKRYMFDMSKAEAEELRRIEKSDVINWYRTYLMPSSPKCRQLAIHIRGSKAASDDASNEKDMPWKIIDDISSFKHSSELYSSLC